MTVSDTDYISTNVTDELALFGIANMGGSVGSITALNFFARMSYEGTPTPTGQSIAYKSGSTTTLCDKVSPTLSFVDYFSGPIETNPDDSAAWELADIDDGALEFGVKAVA